MKKLFLALIIFMVATNVFPQALPVYNKASQIKNTPAGNISSTNVQSAINELDTEKLSSFTEADPTVDSSAEIVAIIGASPTFAFTLPTFGFSAAGDQWKINQTSATGTEWISGNPTGLIWINDDRTGTTVNEKNEATIIIDTPSVGNFGLYNKGASYFDGEVEYALTVYFDSQFIISDGSYSYGIFYRYADDGLHLGIGNDDNKGNRNFIICDNTYRASNFDHNTLASNPTVFIHSATNPDTDNTQWLSFTHDQTDGVIATGKGNINLNPVAGSNITLDGTIAIDAGVVTGATSITSTTFVGALTGTASGNYAPGGTDVAVADGGTGKSSWTQYLIPYADTTTSFSQIAIGSAGQVLTSNGAGSVASFQGSNIQSKSFIITNPTATADSPVWRAPYAITIKAVHLLCKGNVTVGHLTEQDANGLNDAGVDGATDITGIVDTNVNDDGTLSNPSIDSGDYVGWRTTSVTGSPTKAIITFDYTVD